MSLLPDVQFVRRVVLLGTGERVRLIGVDAPETRRSNTPVQYFGKQASAFSKRMAEGFKGGIHLMPKRLRDQF